MKYIFLDESGDLGFNFKKKNTSKHFIVTFLFINDDLKKIEKIVQKTHLELSKKYRRKIGVLHAVKEKPATRRRMLKRLSEVNCSVLIICLDKENVYPELKKDKQSLYNNITATLLGKTFSYRHDRCGSKTYLIASRRETNKVFNENFRSYLNKRARKNYKQEIEISIKTPAQQKILQLVDFVSWAIFRKYEKNDFEYYNLIKNKIVEENYFFPKKAPK